MNEPSPLYRDIFDPGWRESTPPAAPADKAPGGPAMSARHVFTLRAYSQQARAAAAVEQATYLAMLPFAAHVFDDELVFGSTEKYDEAVAAADKAEAELRGAAR